MRTSPPPEALPACDVIVGLLVRISAVLVRTTGGGVDRPGCVAAGVTRRRRHAPCHRQENWVPPPPEYTRRHGFGQGECVELSRRSFVVAPPRPAGRMVGVLHSRPIRAVRNRRLDEGPAFTVGSPRDERLSNTTRPCDGQSTPFTTGTGTHSHLGNLASRSEGRMFVARIKRVSLLFTVRNGWGHRRCRSTP